MQPSALKVAFHRTNSGTAYPPIVSEKYVAEAIHHMFECEIAYGGWFTEVSPEKVVVQTSILACRDAMVIEGSKEEMEAVYAFAILYMRCMKDNREWLIRQTVKELHDVPMLRRALYMTTLAPWILGSASIKAMFASLIATSKEQVQELTKLALRDLIAAALLHLEGAEKAEAVSLLY